MNKVKIQQILKFKKTSFLKIMCAKPRLVGVCRLHYLVLLGIAITLTVTKDVPGEGRKAGLVKSLFF